jgi:diguanylate cyclase (GGDEF)-like protein
VLYTTGRYKDALMEFQISTKDPIIQEMLHNRTAVFPVDPERLITHESLRGIRSLYLLPIFIAEDIEGLIGIFDRILPSEDIKIINAFRDYIQVTLDNQRLRMEINRKSNEILASLSELSRSIAPVLERDGLFQTILDKAIQLLMAEQGSLMLLDRNTSELMVEARRSVDDVVKEKMRIPKGEGIVARVIESRTPILVEDVEKDPRFRQKNRPRYKTKSFISVPIEIEDRVTGVLNISDKVSGEAFNENDLRLIQTFTASAAIAIERNLLYEQVEELKKLSLTDPLTGIYNRRYLDSRLEEEITRYKRYKIPFSFLLLDIDGFKAYNDTFGHMAGDGLLRNMATTIVSSLRNIDIAARFGGDEFVVILPQTPKVDAIHTANRLKESIEKAEVFSQLELPFKNLTVSMGLTTYPDDALTFKELIEKTDQALYLAKKSGGNRVVHL